MAKDEDTSKLKGYSYLNKKFSKDQVIRLYLEGKQTITFLETDIKSKEDTIAELELKIKNMKKGYDVLMTDGTIVKKILEYRAKTYSPTFIREKLIMLGFDVPIERIKNVIYGDLSLENEVFFKDCQKKYQESIKQDSTLWTQSSLNNLQMLIDSCEEDLQNPIIQEDYKYRSQLRKELSGHIKERTTIVKNMTESGVIVEDEVLNETTENYKELGSQIIQINIPQENIKVIGGD